MPHLSVRVRKKPDRKCLQLVYTDPLTGKDVTKSADTSDWGEAERHAQRWEQDLLAGRVTDRITWDKFRQRLDNEYFPRISEKSEKGYDTALNAFEKAVGTPNLVASINPSAITKAESKWRKAGYSASTINTYLRHLKVVLTWGRDMEIISRVPRFPDVQDTKGHFMRGRPITDEEFKAMIAAVPDVRPHDAPAWIRLLQLLMLSGLRLSEALRIDWSEPPIQLKLDGKYPCILYYSEGHKARRDDVVPITPDFFAWLKKTPKDRRHGRLIDVCYKKAAHKAGLVIADICEKAEVKVNESQFATAHDLRRAFGTRWAKVLAPAMLKKLMRHRSIETTMKFYVDLSAEDLGAALYPNLSSKKGSKQQNGKGRTRAVKAKTAVTAE